MAETPGTTTTSRVGHKLAAARALKPLILQHRERIDADRQLPHPILEAMAHLGLFRALVPVSAGGTVSPAGGSSAAGVPMPAGSSRAMRSRARRRGWGR